MHSAKLFNQLEPLHSLTKAFNVRFNRLHAQQSGKFYFGEH